MLPAATRRIGTTPPRPTRIARGRRYRPTCPPQRRRSAGEAYVALCALLAALAIFPPNANYRAYYALVVVMLPVSIVAATVQYLGGLLIFGLEQDGLLVRSAMFIMWLGLAAGQTVTIRALLRSSRPRSITRSESPGDP